MLAEIQDILVISTAQALPHYQMLLGDGGQLGISIQYAIQETPRGLADAFLVGESFIGHDDVCLVLGDNVFYGQNLSLLLRNAQGSIKNGGAAIFGCMVKDPREFGVVEFDEQNKVISIEEKPQHPKSNYAVPGLYIYDNQVVGIAKSVQPSTRGEIEITSVNNEYLNKGQLNVTLMGRGISWLDTGSPKGMHKASGFVKTVQEMQGFYIACIEEIAWRKGFISIAQLHKLGEELAMTDYGKYILSIAEEGAK